MNKRRWLSSLAGVLIAALAPAPFCQAAKRVEIKTDLPPADYSGHQPILTGMPFPEGELKTGEGLRLVDGAGKGLPGQFEVAATWKPDGREVRWLLVDGLIPITNGKAEKVYLEYGPEVKTPAPASPFKIERKEGAVTVDTGRRQYVFDPGGGNVGKFVFRDGRARECAASDWKVEVEKEGPVRCVVKIIGRYLDADGKLVAEFITRYRLYAGQSYARVFHTFIWQTDDKTEIGQVAYHSGLLAGADKESAGLDGTTVTAPVSEEIRFSQVSSGEVRGTKDGVHLDGWVQVDGGKESLFAALRWPWQQFPTAVQAARGQLTLGLIAPEKPMSLRPADVAFPEANARPEQWNCQVYDHSHKVFREDLVADKQEALKILTPRGVARTWEMLLWEDGSISPGVKNLFAQHPVLACADPVFATRAGLPSPMSPKNAQAHPEIEGALDRAFGWYTRELESEHDFGTWNFGDLQWIFTERGGAPIYRYWMNHGKGWSILPWILWMRSGERKYYENALVNSRHCMDVDMCHAPEWESGPPDYRLRGGHYSYDILHWGAGPLLYSFWVDSEYLPYAYYLTGDERARDCMLVHAEALSRFQNRDALVGWYKQDLSQRAGRSLYVMIKNLAVMYEATWDPKLKENLEILLELTRQSQSSKGNFPGIKSNHYLDQGLNIAARVLGWDEVKDMLKKWYDFNGSSLHPGPSGGILGPCSLWSGANLYWHGEGNKYLEDAEGTTRTQAATVVKSNDEWNGLNKIPAHVAGPVLRDWVITMAAENPLPEKDRWRGYMPIAGFASLVAPVAADQKAGYTNRHLAYLLAGDGKDFQLKVYFARPAAGFFLRVRAPDGSVVLEQKADPGFVAGRQIDLKTGLNGDRDLLVFEVPAKGQKGAFALELVTKVTNRLPTPFALKSSTGKLVHCLPAEKGNFFARSVNAGQFWFQPAAGAEKVGISNVDGEIFIGVTRILDESGRELASSRLTGSVPFVPPKQSRVVTNALPKGSACEFAPSAEIASQVLSVVMPSDAYEKWFWNLTGMKPFVSATRDEWFDPSLYPSLSVEQLVGDGKAMISPTGNENATE